MSTSSDSSSTTESMQDQVVPNLQSDPIGLSSQPPINITQTLKKLKVCNNQCQSLRSCPNLHICPVFLYSGSCLYDNDGESDCRFGHTLKTDHNKAILTGIGLDDLKIEELRERLLWIKHNIAAVPICTKYNTALLSHRRSSQLSSGGDTHCAALHICEKFLNNKCSDGDNCSLSHDILANNCPRIFASYGLVDNTEVIEVKEIDVIRILNDFQALQTQPSSSLPRFIMDFHKIKFIGSGGQGEVFKACHILDKQWYAIKKVDLSRKDIDFTEAMREVELIADLRHDNIVQYYSSWLEKNVNCHNNCMSPSSYGSEAGSKDDYWDRDSKGGIKERSSSSGGIDFGASKNDDDIDERGDGHKIHVGSASSVSKPDKLGLPSGNERPLPDDGRPANKQTTDPSTHPTPCTTESYLYIQMELCHHDDDQSRTEDACTLAGRLVGDARKGLPGLKILTKLTEALAFMHEKKVMHRDLKPNNIFFERNSWNIKVGDFGLARYTQDGHNGPSCDYSRKVGTTSYMSPEMLKGIEYDKSTDIYSLAIIAVCLFHPLGSATERCKVVDDTRMKGSPPRVEANTADYLHPSLRKLLREMLSEDPKKRPTAQEILNQLKEMDFADDEAAISYPVQESLEET